MRTFMVEQNSVLSRKKCSSSSATGKATSQIQVLRNGQLPNQTVPFMDLSHQWRFVREDVMNSFEDIFNASAFCLGPYVENFEIQVREFLGVKFAIGVNSGTSAIHLAVKALGLRRGDKVLVPSHTFVGTIWGLIYEGIVPVFCDVSRHCGTIDVATLMETDTSDVRAIIAVHLYGQPADMAKIIEFAKARKLFVIEDVAQAFGANIDNQMLGTLGDIGCFSFYPGKNLGAAGEAGLVITNSETLAQKIKCLRNHGQSERYKHDKIGYNYRMDGLQAAVLSAKIAYVKSWNDERREIAKQYIDQLAELPLKLPQKIAQDHVWHLFVVRLKQRDRLKTHLEKRGVSTGLHYPIPLHNQSFVRGFLTKPPALPITENWAAQCLSLPIFPGMTECQVQNVVQAVGDFYA